MTVAISTIHVIASFNSAVIGPIDAFVGTPTPEAGVGFRIIGSTQPEPSGLAVSWPLGDIDCVQTFWEKKWRGRRVTGCGIRGDRPLTVLRFTVALPAASDWSSQADRQSDMEQFESLALNVARAVAQYRMAQNPEGSSRLRQIHDGQWTDGDGVSTAHLSA